MSIFVGMWSFLLSVPLYDKIRIKAMLNRETHIRHVENKKTIRDVIRDVIVQGEVKTLARKSQERFGNIIAARER